MQEPQEMQAPSPGEQDPLGEETGAHSCILVWRIPWTEEPGRLWSMGSQRIGYNLVTERQQQSSDKVFEISCYPNAQDFSLCFKSFDSLQGTFGNQQPAF